MSGIRTPLYKDFIENLQKAFDHPLPGEEAQYRMAPYERTLREEAMRSNSNPTPGAVLILIYPVNGVPHTILMLRTSYDGVHSSQVSFPGGKKDPDDESLKHTALREAKEEVGVSGAEVEVMGKLSQVFIPPSGFLATPFIGYVKEKPQFRPDPKEVDTLIEVEVSHITDERIVKKTDIRLHAQNITITAPYFDIQGHVVWGATAMMLSELKEILKKIM